MTRNVARLMFALLLGAPAAAVAVPGTVSFSARIADAGRPVTGNHTFTFEFWDCDGTDAATCFAPDHVIWSETQTRPVHDGVVTAALGADTTTPNLFPPVLFNGSPRWLVVTMDGAKFGPSMAVHSVPYAMRAGTADSVAWANVTAKPTTPMNVFLTVTIPATTCMHWNDGTACPAGYVATGVGCTTIANNVPITNQYINGNAARCGWCNNNAFAVTGTIYTFCVRF